MAHGIRLVTRAMSVDGVCSPHRCCRPTHFGVHCRLAPSLIINVQMRGVCMYHGRQGNINKELEGLRKQMDSENREEE